MIHRWIPSSCIALAMVFALTGSAVFAFGSEKVSEKTDVFERAAKILGIEASALLSAHHQAKRDAYDENVLKSINRMTNGGLIDQDQADTFTSWMAGRPNANGDLIFIKLTATLVNKRAYDKRPSNHEKRPETQYEYLIDRMAEILGIDPEELRKALEPGKIEPQAINRIDLLHNMIDEMHEKGEIDSSEAEQLHKWIDETPDWLLNMGASSQDKPLIEVPGNRHNELDHLKNSPFKDLADLPQGLHKFKFEYHGPDGSFKFGPEDLKKHEFLTPKKPRAPKGLNERFGELEELENIDEIRKFMDQLHERGMFDYPFEDFEASPKTNDNPITTA